MTKYFMQGTKHAAFERMMMEVPKGPRRMEPPAAPPPEGGQGGRT